MSIFPAQSVMAEHKGKESEHTAQFPVTFTVKQAGNRISAIAVWCALSAAIGLLAPGCATMKVVSTDRLNEQRFSETGTPIAHLYLDNWGIYLFKYIPLVTGNVDTAGQAQVSRLFTNNVRVDLLVDKLTKESQRLGGTVITDLRTRDRSYWIPWALFFWLNEFEVSGNASSPLPPAQILPESILSGGCQFDSCSLCRGNVTNSLAKHD